MVTKRDLGVGYLAGIGLALIGLLIWRFWAAASPAYLSLVGTTTGVILAGAMVYLAYWLIQSDLQADHVWAVSKWGAVGLTLPMVATVVIGFVQAGSIVLVESSVMINNAAAGAVIGALFGAITELEAEHGRATELNRRNVVLNRVLRHDIRNDVSILLAYAERYRDQLSAGGQEFVNAVEGKVDEILGLTEAAGWVDDLDERTSGQPVDLVTLIDERCQTFAQTHPHATFETDMPAEAWVRADEMLRTVIDNLIENAIEHHDGEPTVVITGRSVPERDVVEVTIADDGPGLPAQYRNQVEDWATFDALHGNPGQGLGLWLVRWFVDSYDGAIHVKDRKPRGTAITLTLPAASGSRTSASTPAISA